MEYFRSIDNEEVDLLFEAKLLIVGEPGAGKTSLRYRIMDEGRELPQEDESTKGIEIEFFSFKILIKHLFWMNSWNFV